MTVTTHPPRAGHLEIVLDEARDRIQVNEPELELAKQWREDIADILRTTFPNCRIYYNGSVAHGDALTPLTDVDLGVVVPDKDALYGPDKNGPTSLQERAADELRDGLKDKHGEVFVYLKGRTRSVLVRFREPVFEGWEDFSADVIVAIDNPDADGLYIPKCDKWDRAHPEKHTKRVCCVGRSGGVVERSAGGSQMASTSSSNASSSRRCAGPSVAIS